MASLTGLQALQVFSSSHFSNVIWERRYLEPAGLQYVTSTLFKSREEADRIVNIFKTTIADIQKNVFSAESRTHLGQFRVCIHNPDLVDQLLARLSQAQKARELSLSVHNPLDHSSLAHRKLFLAPNGEQMCFVTEEGWAKEQKYS